MLAWLLILIYLLLITPIQGGLRIFYDDGSLKGVTILRIWGVWLQIPLALRRDAQGQLRLESEFRRKRKRAKKEKPDALRRLISQSTALIRADKSRRLLLWGVHLESLEGEWHLHLDNAAHTALLSALGQILSSLPAKARIRIFPNFGGPSRLHLQCIVRFRLGILLTACAMGYISYRSQRKKEETKWIIPSDA